MKQDRFPPGWDEERVRKVLAHYKEQKVELHELMVSKVPFTTQTITG